MVKTTLIVKHTFLEYIDCGPVHSCRARTVSEPCLESVQTSCANGCDDDNDDDGCSTCTDSTATPLYAPSESDLETSTDGVQTPPLRAPGIFWPVLNPVQTHIFPLLVTAIDHSLASENDFEDVTLMLKNIPNDYTRCMLLDLLDGQGFAGKYDFVYLPVDFRSGSAFGYAFINFVSSHDTELFRDHFHRFSAWAIPSKKIAEVTWSRPSQGLNMNIEKYRNSSVMHAQVPDEYKPVIFQDGVQVSFPPPTKVLSLPEEMTIGSLQFARPNGWRSTSEHKEEAQKTTLMLRNIPNDYSRAMLIELLRQQGFAGTYDFLYLPIDFTRGAGIGYAFINMVSQSIALQFLEHFTGFSGWVVPSRKVAEVSWSNPNQGLDVHVERYRNSTVMHPSVPDEFKPIVLQNGQRVEFPSPTRVIRPPRN